MLKEQLENALLMAVAGAVLLKTVQRAHRGPPANAKHTVAVADACFLTAPRAHVDRRTSARRMVVAGDVRPKAATTVPLAQCALVAASHMVAGVSASSMVVLRVLRDLLRSVRLMVVVADV
jgi:hypothetical protein